MNYIKKMSLCCIPLMVFVHAQAEQINPNLVAWTKNNVSEIAQRISKNPAFFNKRNQILTEQFLLQALDSEEYSGYDQVVEDSRENKAYVLGAIQAELDQSKLAFSGQSIPRDNDEMLQKEAEQRLGSWIQKNSNKLIEYFTNKQVIPSSFDELVEACKSLKIQMPATLNSATKEYLLNEIVAGFYLNDMSSVDLNKMFNKTFDKKQQEYLKEYLLPKIASLGIESVTISSLIDFLENLPNKGFTGKAFLKNLTKSHLKTQMIVVDIVNEKLTMQHKLLNIVEVVQQLQIFESLFVPLQEQKKQYTELERIVEVVKELSENNGSLLGFAWKKKFEARISTKNIEKLVALKKELNDIFNNTTLKLSTDDKLFLDQILDMVEKRIKLLS